MLKLRSGRWSFVVTEAGSGGWSLCWDVVVVVVVVVVIVVDVVVDDDFTFNF